MVLDTIKRLKFEILMSYSIEMKKINIEIPEGKTLRELLPHLTEEEFKEVEKSLERYFLLALKVYEKNKSKNTDLTITKDQL